jgi:ubiquinone/menaquinone biosynthesis C-methylase UbiE
MLKLFFSIVFTTQIHHLHRLIVDGKLATAPIENPKDVLDIGTGTGKMILNFTLRIAHQSRYLGNRLC